MDQRISQIKHLRDYSDEQAIHLSIKHYPKHHRIPLHSHDFYELSIVLAGSLHHDYNGRQIMVEKGGIQLVYPLDIHTYEGASDEDNVLLNLAFSQETYRRLMTALRMEEELKGLTRIKAFQVDLLYSKLALIDTGSLSTYQLVLNQLVEYHCCLSSELTTEGNCKDVVPIWLKKAMNRMLTIENLQLGLDQFVRLSGKSKEHLSRTVKKLFGITAGRWINEHRLEMARKLLRQKDLSIIDISYEVGFNSESYFYRRYKEYYGVTPLEDRKELMKKEDSQD